MRKRNLSPEVNNKIEQKLFSLNFISGNCPYQEIYSLLVSLASGNKIPEIELIGVLSKKEVDSLILTSLIIKIFDDYEGNYFILNPNFENQINGLDPIIKESLKVSKNLALSVMKEMLGEYYSNDAVQNSCEIIARTIDATRSYDVKLKYSSREYLDVLRRYDPFKDKLILIHLEDNVGERVKLHPSFIAKCKIELAKTK